MIPENFKPMLAISSEKVKTQPTYQYCSIKLDGVRCLFFGGVAYSRTMKPLPNLQLQQLAKQHQDVLEGCDGEVIAGDIFDKGCLQRSVSFCMNADKEDDFVVYLFDKYHPTKPWLHRYLDLLDKEQQLPARIKVLEHFYVRPSVPQIELFSLEFSNKLSWVNLELFEQDVLSNGGEGVVVRDAEGKYKLGRSGTKKPELQKLKRMQDAEFEVVGYTQFEHNQNEAYTDEVGNTKRSTSKDGKVLVEQLGSLICKLTDGRTFNVGSGFTLEQRNALWASKEILVGKIAKVQFFRYSPDGVPLLPVFLDFRHELDM